MTAAPAGGPGRCIQNGGCLHRSLERRDLARLNPGDAPMEYLFETLIPVVFYAAVLLFLFSNLNEA